MYMSVSFGGRVMGSGCGEGNVMFLVFTGIIYGRKHGLYVNSSQNKIKCVLINNINDNIDNCQENLVSKLLTDNEYDENSELNYYGRCHYTLSGYFQNARYINKYANYILEAVELKTPQLPNYKISDNDVLCTLRLGDMKHQGEKNSEIISPNYFQDIFKINNFDKIYFLIYPGDDEIINKYMSHLDKDYIHRIVFVNNGNILSDFYLIQMFKNVIISISTFHWWSVFFLPNIEETNIYTPMYFGCCGKPMKQRHHAHELWNIRNRTLCQDHEFVSL